MYTSCWKKIANEREKERAEEGHNKHVTNGRDNAREKQKQDDDDKNWQKSDKMLAQVFHFISFHSLPCPAKSFHFIPFHSVPLCSHLCQFIWWHGHVCSASSIFHLPFSLYLSFCGIIIKMPWPGGRLCKIFWCLKVRKTKQKKNGDMNWHLIRESTKGFQWPKQNVFNLF